MNKIFFLPALLALGLARPVRAAGFSLRPTLSLMGSYTLTQNYPELKAGLFDLHNRRFNFGLSLTNKCYLSGNWFIRTGFRYNQYRTRIEDKNHTAADPAFLSWETKQESVLVPLLLGKDFISPAGKRGDIYAGLSLGMLLTSNSSSKFESNLAGDLFRLENSNASRMVSTFFPAVDLGFHYQLFKKLPRFTAGILASLQPVRTKPFSYRGLVRNRSTGSGYPYNIQNRERLIFNGALIFSYTFGRLKTDTRGNNPFKCPE